MTRSAREREGGASGNPYQDGYRVQHEGTLLVVDLVYPGTNPSNPTTIEIGLEHVRAADSIRVTFDFDRNGWSVMQPDDVGPYEEAGERTWREVAFVDAFGLEEAKP